MKKIIFSSFGVFFFCLMFIGVSKAQIIVLPEVTITAKNVPEKVQKAFEGSFKDAIDPTWYESNKSYLVKFLMNDMTNQAVFKKNGSIVYHIAYGFEKDLPVTVADLLKKEYPGYSIIVAINVLQDQRDIWLVNMENDKFIIKVGVEDGVATVAERIRKSQ